MQKGTLRNKSDSAETCAMGQHQTVIIKPASNKDKLGMYHWAPPRTGSYKYKQQIADGQLISRQ
jgi:hypothetical protein